jgi:hypothetical protein
MNCSLLSVVSGLVLLAGAGCAPGVTSKSWHTSPGPSDIQDAYPDVQWDVVQQVRPGMRADDAVRLVRELQWYRHPINAIVYSHHFGHVYEVALRLSEDKKTITDISYKLLR